MFADAITSTAGCFSFTQHILKENNFVCVRYWLNELTGRKIEDFERFTLQSRLAPCAERLGFANINEYVEFLGTQTTDFSLPSWQSLLDSALETDSWFRRESTHFNFLRQIVLPKLQKNLTTQHLRLLSAGCGEGEEAYDMAFECADFLGLDASWQVDGIDIRSDAIERATLGQWELEDCAVLPEHCVDRWLKPRYNGLKILPELRAKMAFECRNLLQVAQQNAYDVIFCRNVVMDMEKRSGDALIQKLMSALKPNGYLIVSHNENLNDIVASENLLSPQIARKF